MSNLKTESHIERKNRSLIIGFIGEFECKKFVREQSVDKVSNTIISEKKLKSYSPDENTRGYKCSDFAIANIIASGAASDMLFDCKALPSDDIDTSISNIENQLSNLSNNE